MQLLYRGVCRGFVECCVPKMALSVQYNSAVSDSSLSWLYFNNELYFMNLFKAFNNQIKYNLDFSCFSLFVFPVFLASLETHSLCPEISEQSEMSIVMCQPIRSQYYLYQSGHLSRSYP